METPQKKYATVQINIPIEIYPNGEFIKREDCITLNIFEIQELPPISTIDNTILKTTIQEMFSDIDGPKFRFNIYEDEENDEQTCPFIIKSSPQESPREEPTKNIIQEFISKNLLENRTKSIPKNTSFKKTPKSHNKTRSNRF
jgi:hypothetical protein